jgi:hypothetical protein
MTVVRLLGEGYNVRAYEVEPDPRRGLDLTIAKQIKVFSLFRRPHVLNARQRDLRAGLVEWICNQLRQPGDFTSRFGLIVPRTLFIGDGVLLQAAVSGMTADALPPAPRQIASVERAEAVRLARQRLPTFEFSISAANFLFDEAGRITGWFDPLRDTRLQPALPREDLHATPQ